MTNSNSPKLKNGCQSIFNIWCVVLINFLLSKFIHYLFAIFDKNQDKCVKIWSCSWFICNYFQLFKYIFINLPHWNPQIKT